MKILHILNDIKASGAETMLESAAPYWKQANISSAILATGKEIGPYKLELEKAGYSIYHIPLKRIFKIPTINFSLTILRFIKNHKFDLIHIHPEKASFLYVLLAILTRTKAIRTVHHIFPPEPGLLGFIKRSIRCLNRLLCRRFDITVVSNSDSGLENEIKSHFSDNQLIYNWFDNNRFPPRKFSSYIQFRDKLNYSDKLVLVSVGGNWGYKNYDKIIHAIYLLPDYLKEKLLYIQIGTDPGFQLAALVQDLKLSDYVKIMGRVDSPYEYLCAADAFIMPSTVEGFGCAAAEAMSIGLFTILSNRPALIDYKNHIDGGVWVEPSIQEIKNALLDLLKFDRNDLFQLGARNSDVISKKFSSIVGAESYLALYKSKKL